MMPKMHILKFIPERIGYSTALDDAVRCITHVKCSPIQDDSGPRQQYYVKALRSLQEAVQSQATLRAPETLAAASLLQMYEVHIDLPGRNWVHHARGAVRILQLNNSMDVSSGLQRAILAAEASEMFLSGLIKKQYHLLYRPGWLQIQLDPSKETTETTLEKLMRIFVDGTRFDDVGSFCSHFASSCEFDRGFCLSRADRLAKGTISDLLRLRTQLWDLIDDEAMSTSLAEVHGAVGLAASASLKCFLLITISYILWFCKESAKLKGYKVSFLPDNLTEAHIEDERWNLLESITAHFNQLAEVDPDLRVRAATALRVMLGSLQATELPGRNDYGESAVLLRMLEPGLEDAGWG